MKERAKSYPEGWDVHCKRLAEALTTEKRQEFIDYVWKGHLSVGEAGDKADLNFDETSGIMMMQIKSATYFDTVAVKV